MDSKAVLHTQLPEALHEPWLLQVISSEHAIEVLEFKKTDTNEKDTKAFWIAIITWSTQRALNISRIGEKASGAGRACIVTKARKEFSWTSKTSWVYYSNFSCWASFFNSSIFTRVTVCFASWLSSNFQTLRQWICISLLKTIIMIIVITYMKHNDTIDMNASTTTTSSTTITCSSNGINLRSSTT